MLPSLSGLSLQVPHVPIDALGKRKLSDTDPIELVRALVEAALLWTTHKARAHRQIHKSTMRHTVVEKEQGGFEVDVHFRKESSTASTTNHVKIDLPAPFEAPYGCLRFAREALTAFLIKSKRTGSLNASGNFADFFEAFPLIE